MSRYQNEDELPFDIPKQLVLIDDIILDEELQLIRDEFLEDMAPIEAAWAAYDSRAAHPQLLPMQILEIDPRWHATALQAEFLKHLVYQGEIAAGEAHSLVRRAVFVTALEMFEKKYGRPITQAIGVSDLMQELRAVA
jgi:hypothetical protein